MQKHRAEPSKGNGCLLRFTCLVTLANEQQLDSSQLTLAIRLKPKEIRRGGARKREKGKEFGAVGNGGMVK